MRLIPEAVKVEVVDRGKDEGFGDAFLIEKGITDGWISIVSNPPEMEDIVEKAGIDAGGAAAISLALQKGYLLLIDDLARKKICRWSWTGDYRECRSYPESSEGRKILQGRSN